MQQSYGVQAQGYVWDVDTLDWIKATSSGVAPSSDVSVTNFPAVQPVSLATAPTTPVTNANLDVGLSTRLKAADTLAKVATLDTITNPVAVTGAFYPATQPVSLVSMPSTPVTGAFFQATQPISAASLPLPTGAALDATLAAQSAKLPASLGQKEMAASLSVTLASNQSAVPVSLAAAATLFKGRACTFRTPGRAGTAGQNLLSLHNATGSPVTATINHLFVDLACTVIKAVTVLPPVIRCWLVTVLPTNGTALTKNQVGGSGASNAAVTVKGDASADGTGSTTTLTATLPTGTFVSQEFAPRFITAAGYEMADRVEFFGNGETIVLGPLQGVVVFLDYTLATQNPTTDMWTAGIDWSEN